MLIVALLPLRFGGVTLRESPFVTRAVSDIRGSVSSARQPPPFLSPPLNMFFFHQVFISKLVVQHGLPTWAAHLRLRLRLQPPPSRHLNRASQPRHRTSRHLRRCLRPPRRLSQILNIRNTPAVRVQVMDAAMGRAGLLPALVVPRTIIFFPTRPPPPEFLRRLRHKIRLRLPFRGIAI